MVRYFALFLCRYVILSPCQYYWNSGSSEAPEPTNNLPSLADPEIFKTSKIEYKVAENGHHDCELIATRAIQKPGSDIEPSLLHSTVLDEVVPAQGVNFDTVSTDVAAAVPIPDSNFADGCCSEISSLTVFHRLEEAHIEIRPGPSTIARS